MKEIKFTLNIAKRIVGKETIYTFIVKAKNLTNNNIKIKPGMALFDSVRPNVHPRLKLLNFTPLDILEAHKETIILVDDLNKDKVSNYRFWFNRYDGFGLENINSKRYWVTTVQHNNTIKEIDVLAVLYGVEDDDLGLVIEMNKQDEVIDRIINGNKPSGQSGINSSKKEPDKILEVEYEEGISSDPNNNVTDLIYNND